MLADQHREWYLLLSDSVAKDLTKTAYPTLQVCTHGVKSHTTLACTHRGVKEASGIRIQPPAKRQ